MALAMSTAMAMVLTLKCTAQEFGPYFTTYFLFLRAFLIVQLLKAGRRCEECLPSMLLQQSGVLLIKVDFCHHHHHHNIFICIIIMKNITQTEKYAGLCQEAYLLTLDSVALPLCPCSCATVVLNNKELLIFC